MEKITTQATTNTFVTTFLKGERFKNVDWVKNGRYFRNLVFPPKVDVNVNDFADGLKETIKEKLEIALVAQEELRRQRRKRIKRIIDFVAEENEWFYLELEAAIFSEYYVIREWVNYWLFLWDEIHGIKKPQKRGWISEDDIQKAKRFPIERLYKGKLKKSGNKLVGPCPFHRDKHPSFFIYPDNHWHCFGACNEGGDSIKFLMKLTNNNFIEAVKYLTYGHN